MNSIRLDKRDLILAKGAAVMTRRGYHGTGVQEIVQAAGIPKGLDHKVAYKNPATTVDPDPYTLSDLATSIKTYLGV